MNNFDLWINGCKINRTKVYPLMGKHDTALYKCWKSYMSNYKEYNETPVYIVWINGKQICATTNYQSALNLYKINGGK